VKAAEQQIEALLSTLEQHVTDIHGIGPVLAASLLAEIGDIQRFPRLESLVAYAGIDPSVSASGEFTATETHMSKRGSPHLRRALWLAAVSASRSNPDLAAYLQRRLDQGKPWGTAMGGGCSEAARSDLRPPAPQPPLRGALKLASTTRRPYLTPHSRSLRWERGAGG
jgi:transposase